MTHTVPEQDLWEGNSACGRRGLASSQRRFSPGGFSMKRSGVAQRSRCWVTATTSEGSSRTESDTTGDVALYRRLSNDGVSGAAVWAAPKAVFPKPALSPARAFDLRTTTHRST